MRYVLPDKNGNAGYINQARMEYMCEVFNASESKYKHKHVLNCDIDTHLRIFFIIGHLTDVHSYIRKCQTESDLVYFKSADRIILITCDAGLSQVFRGMSEFQGKLFIHKPDFLEKWTAVNDYGLGFDSTAFEAALFRERPIKTTAQFQNVADKYLVAIKV